MNPELGFRIVRGSVCKLSLHSETSIDYPDPQKTLAFVDESAKIKCMSSPERRDSRPSDARPDDAAQPVDDRFPAATDSDIPAVPPIAVPPIAVPPVSAPSAHTPMSEEELQAVIKHDMEILAELDDELLASAEPAELPPRWDANDPRRQKDCFAPPTEPCECYCLHCNRTFNSDQIWFQKVINDPQGFEGFWMCPTPNCSGAGFTFDLFPTDPVHPANEGWHYDDEDEDDFGSADDDDDHDDVAAWAEDAGDNDEYDPSESKYREMDDIFGTEADDDMEGEEWKYGLQPGERPNSPLAEEANREWRREQEMYDEPDQRPRILDWSDRQDRRHPPVPLDGDDAPGPFRDDDIPF